MKRRTFFASLFAPLAIDSAAQTSSEDAAREKRLAWWREAHFGMFIHWGLYAIPAGEWKGRPVEGIGEWIMNHARIPVREYEQLARQFNPVQFDAEAWVKVAKDAGMKYITITSKHHDGFSMFGTKVSKFNIVDATPFHRDPMKELAAACRKAGLRLCFYYSQAQDWHEPDAAGNNWDWPDESKKNFAKYLEEKVKPQVRELLTNYGPIGLIWFDTPRVITKQQSEELTALVYQLQPACLVNSRVGHGAGDYESAGDNQISVGKVTRAWETPVTLNDTWGFKKDDHNWKPPAVLVRQLVQVVSRGGNYLLNVGPTAEGVIPQPSVERLEEVGRWMKVNGESIYGNSPGPFPYELPWGVMTSKTGKLYLHLFEWPRKELLLYGLKSKVRSAYLLADRKPLTVSQQADRKLDLHSLRIELPDAKPDPFDSVIALEMAGMPEADPSLMQQPDGSVTLVSYLGEMHKAGKGGMQLDSRGVIERWLSSDEWLSWDFKIWRPGTFNVMLLSSEQKYGRGWEGGHQVRIDVAGHEIRGAVGEDGKEENPNNPYWKYVVSKMGGVTFDRPGKYHLSLKADKIQGKKFGLTLVSVKLTPQ